MYIQYKTGQCKPINKVIIVRLELYVNVCHSTLRVSYGLI